MIKVQWRLTHLWSMSRDVTLLNSSILSFYVQRVKKLFLAAMITEMSVVLESRYMYSLYSLSGNVQVDLYKLTLMINVINNAIFNYTIFYSSFSLCR